MDIAMNLSWLFPAAVVISTVAMASGVGGAIFFSPLFIIVLGLDPKVAIGTALITELFGFSSGLFSYSRLKLIDYKLGLKILVFSVPTALIGLYIGRFLSPDLLKAIFGAGIIFIAYEIYSEWRKENAHKGTSHEMESEIRKHESEHIDASGKHYQYTICNIRIMNILSSIGGLFVGMISVGLGELLDYQLVSKCKVPAPIAVGTVVFAVVITVLAASLGHFYEFFFHAEPGVFSEVLGIVIFTIPGVLIGGQIGPRLQKFIPEYIIKVGLSILFVLIGLLMFYTLLL